MKKTHFGSNVCTMESEGTEEKQAEMVGEVLGGKMEEQWRGSSMRNSNTAALILLLQK